MYQSTVQPTGFKFASFVYLVALALVLSGCGRTLTGGAPSVTPPGNPVGPNVLTPEALEENFGSLSLQTSQSANSQAQEQVNLGLFDTGATGSEPVPTNYLPLADILRPGLFMNPASLGFQRVIEVGRLYVTGNRLVPAPNTVSLANLNYSFPDVYMGGHIEVATGGPGAYAGFFGRHHDPNGEDHCLATCQLRNDGTAVWAEILTLFGTQQNPILSRTQVPAPHGIVECLMFRDTIAMYYNGVLVGLVEDDVIRSSASTVHESLFGFRTFNGTFGSATIADLQLVRDNAPIVLYRNNWDRQPSPILGPQWRTNGIQVFNNRLVNSYPGQLGTAVMDPSTSNTVHTVNVNDVDVRTDFRLLGYNARAGIILGTNYRARVFKSGGYLKVGLYHGENLVYAGQRGLVKVVPPNVAPNDQGSLRVIVDDDYVQIYVNNQLILTHRFPSVVLGTLGLEMRDAETDNFSIRTL